MSFKHISAAVAASALLGSVAFAQTPTTTSDRAGMAPSETSSSSSSFQGNWRVSKVVGLSVYNDNNQSIGSINDLLTDKSGNIKAAVIGVGGFLGVGEHLVVIPFDKIKFVNEPVAYVGASGNATGQPPVSSTTTTGSASTTGAASTTSSSKPNPWYPDHAVYNATKDELKTMPEFKYSN